jgi:hypothetical protein
MRKIAISSTIQPEVQAANQWGIAMPKRKRSRYAHIRFTPFAEEQAEALKLFAQLPGLREVMGSLARDRHPHDERGLIIWLSTSGLAKNLQPPAFQSFAQNC